MTRASTSALLAVALVAMAASAHAFGTSTGFEGGVEDFEYLEHMGDGKLVLRYFDLRGKAEPIRLMLEYLGLAYKDIRYNKERWLEVKKSGKFAFEQLPALTYCPNDRAEESDPECIHMVQSQTILRFLARRYNKYGPENMRHWVDLVADGADDAKSKLSSISYNPDCEKLLPEYLETTMPLWLGHLERLKASHPKLPTYFTSETITHADLMVFNVIELNERVAGPDMLHQYPNLHAFKHAVLRNGGVSAYVKAERRPLHANGASACLDSESNPSPYNDLIHAEDPAATAPPQYDEDGNPIGPPQHASDL